MTDPTPDAMDDFVVRLGCAAVLGIALMLVLGVVMPGFGPGVALVLAFPLGWRICRGHVPPQAEGWLVTVGMYAAGALLIAS